MPCRKKYKVGQWHNINTEFYAGFVHWFLAVHGLILLSNVPRSEIICISVSFFFNFEDGPSEFRNNLLVSFSAVMIGRGRIVMFHIREVLGMNPGQYIMLAEVHLPLSTGLLRSSKFVAEIFLIIDQGI
jgi:hypothetical protein